MKDPHRLLRNASKSFWSFLDSSDIQQAFTDVTWDQEKVSWDSLASFFSERVKVVPSDGFVDAFMDLVLYINTCPPGTPITVEWNKNLPCYVSTGESQAFRAFAELPKDLPFVYGSLTASRTSFRPWLGPINTAAFHVPGMEFFATTGEYKNETEWRNPAGRWLRQVIPKGDQLPKFLDEYENIYIKDLPGHAYNFVDDAFDGRITVSHKGVHFAETQYGFSEGHGFWEDELDTDLTQAIQSTEALHISLPCNSATHKVITSEETGARAGQMASVCNLNILPATVGSAAGQAAPFRRVPGSKEPLNDLAPVARSSPRRADLAPSPSMAGSHVHFFGKIFRQIIPLSIIRYTPMSGTPSFIQAPGDHTAGVPGLQTRAAPKCFARAEENALGASLNAQSQAQDIPGGSSSADFSRLTLSFRAHSKAPDKISLRAYSEQLLGSLNAQSQAPDDPLSLRAYIGLLWASFHAQDHQCDPHIFVDYNHFCRHEPARSLTTQDSLYFSLQQVLPPSDTLLPPPLSSLCKVYMRNQEMPQSGDSVVRQGVVCSLSGGLVFSWICTAIVFYDPCGSSLFVSMYISLAFSLRRFA
jgi:hypothetical protein